MTSEAKVIANTEGFPATSQSIEEDLISLGIQPGNILLVHSSLSALGWVCGGAPTVIDALLKSIRPHRNARTDTEKEPSTHRPNRCKTAAEVRPGFLEQTGDPAAAQQMGLHFWG